MNAKAQHILFDLIQDGLVIGQKISISQRKLKPRQYVDYEKSLFPLPSLKQYHDRRACLGWHRFELEVSGDVLGDSVYLFFEFTIIVRHIKLLGGYAGEKINS